MGIKQKYIQCTQEGCKFKVWFTHKEGDTRMCKALKPPVHNEEAHKLKGREPTIISRMGPYGWRADNPWAKAEFLIIPKKDQTLYSVL